ncbi:MAG: tRNA (adenosine(37)-N6)-threonylcarbamoyltransferase complex dimerization subunit type 1 TsaB [Ruminococcaceae bacterium]|nr:tRNA (adenosine(37)-N6)-threonylcarbamoyltransferase complex dimerization subunit type 1 TsaB [Oscillospiraceae bacterium]
MIILALDSTAKAAAVALLRDENLIAKDMHDDGNTHSSTLLPMVEELLIQNSLTVNDIDLFAASAGPGSFTGVRIGAATIKGLAFGKNKPCVAVSALEALAYNMRDTDGIVCALMDARRGQFYTATFEIANGKVSRLTPDEAKSGEDIAASLKKHEKVYLVGDGANVAIPFFGGNVQLAPADRLLADGESVGLLAKKLFESGKSVSDAEFAPTYLRLPQAERERLEKLQKEDIK